MIGDKKAARKQARKEKMKAREQPPVYVPAMTGWDIAATIFLLMGVAGAAWLGGIVLQAKMEIDAKEYAKMLPGIIPMN